MTTVVLWYIRETGKAYLYSLTPPEREQIEVWVPKSIVEHRTKRGDQHEVKLPDWFADKYL
jgi:hypothetical protein